MLSKNLLARSDGDMFLVDKIFDLDFHNFSEIGHFWTHKSVKMVINEDPELSAEVGRSCDIKARVQQCLEAGGDAFEQFRT